MAIRLMQNKSAKLFRYQPITGLDRGLLDRRRSTLSTGVHCPSKATPTSRSSVSFLLSPIKGMLERTRPHTRCENTKSRVRFVSDHEVLGSGRKADNKPKKSLERSLTLPEIDLRLHEQRPEKSSWTKAVTKEELEPSAEEGLLPAVHSDNGELMEAELDEMSVCSDKDGTMLPTTDTLPASPPRRSVVGFVDQLGDPRISVKVKTFLDEQWQFNREIRHPRGRVQTSTEKTQK